jgi:hypothetical protein
MLTNTILIISLQQVNRKHGSLSNSRFATPTKLKEKPQACQKIILNAWLIKMSPKGSYQKLNSMDAAFEVPLPIHARHDEIQEELRTFMREEHPYFQSVENVMKKYDAAVGPVILVRLTPANPTKKTVNT